MTSIWRENMLGCWSLDIICSSKLTVFLELRSRKTVHLSEQILSTGKYPSIFSRQMAVTVYVSEIWQNVSAKCFAVCDFFIKVGVIKRQYLKEYFLRVKSNLIIF